MKQLVLISGGFHPFHPGHLSLYQAAKETFPSADVVVAATNDTSSRPFPFKIKQKLAQVSGVPPRDFVEVSRQFNAMEPAIASRIKNINDTVLIFVRSDKDKNKPPLPAALDPATGQLPLAKRGPNKGQPVSDYLQYLAGNEDNIQPMTQHAYMAYLPTEEFGSGMTSASEIRAEWPNLDQQGKIDRVMSLYPATQSNPALAKNVVKMLDTAMGTEIKGQVSTDRYDDGLESGAVKTAMGENQGWAATYEATSAQNFVGGMKAGYQARENQPVSEDYVLEKTSI